MTDHLVMRLLRGLPVYVRQDGVDEMVLTEDYQRVRFFAPGYDLKDTDVILDVGAHIGAFTLLAAHRVSRGLVHSIEPASTNFNLLLKNIAVNELENVRAHRIALGSSVGEVTLQHDQESWGHTTCSQHSGLDSVQENVPCQTLAYFLYLNGIRHVDYMKVNVEGAEYGILLNTPREVLRTIAFMLVEIHRARNSVRRRLVDWLMSCGYDLDITWSTEEKGKGWIAAARASK